MDASSLQKMDSLIQAIFRRGNEPEKRVDVLQNSEIYATIRDLFKFEDEDMQRVHLVTDDHDILLSEIRVTVVDPSWRNLWISLRIDGQEKGRIYFEYL